MCKMNLWNEKDLPMPPINTYKAANTNIDIKHLYNVFNEGKEFFDNDKYLHVEYSVLSIVFYRMRQKFRTAKDFKALAKLNKALKNYFEVNLSSNLKKFMDLIPSKYEDETYLPTKSLLDYILVRLQGLVKLMERIVETSKIAAFLLNKRMQIGHFWKIAFITFSAASRVFVLARHAAKFICEFYRKLLPFSQQLKNTRTDWLPENYSLPKDLKEWLNVDWLEFDDDVQIIEVSTEMSDITKFFDLVGDDDDDVQFCDEYFMIDDDDERNDVKIIKEFKKIVNNKVKNPASENTAGMRGFDAHEDIGEVIEVKGTSKGTIGKVKDNYMPLKTEKTDTNNSERNTNLGQLKVRDVNKLRGINENLFPRNAGASCSDSDTINDENESEVCQDVSKIKIEENNWVLKTDDTITICDVSTTHITGTKTKFEPNDIESEIDEETSATVSGISVINKQKSEVVIKSHHDDNALLVENSDDEYSVDNSIEESIVTISDTSLTDIKDNKSEIFNRQNDTLVIDSDEDVITLSDISVSGTKDSTQKKKVRKKISKNGRRLKQKKKKLNTSLKCDDSFLNKNVNRKRKKLTKELDSNETEEPGRDDGLSSREKEDRLIDELEKKIKNWGKKKERSEQTRIKQKSNIGGNSSLSTHPGNSNTKSKDNIPSDITLLVKKKIKELETIILKSINRDKTKVKKKMNGRPEKNVREGKKLKKKRKDITKIANLDTEAQPSTSAKIVNLTETVQQINHAEEASTDYDKFLDKLIADAKKLKRLQRKKRNQLKKQENITNNVISEPPQNSVNETTKEENSTVKVITSTSNVKHNEVNSTGTVTDQTNSSVANTSIVNFNKRKWSDPNKSRINGTDTDESLNKRRKNEISPIEDSSNKETREAAFGKIDNNSPDSDKPKKKKRNRKKKKKPKVFKKPKKTYYLRNRKNDNDVVCTDDV